jgi:Right handed beta helix region
MRVKMTFAAAALAALLSALLAGPATARVIHVGPGESIQAAVDQAAPGTTIKIAAGTYHQNVQIKKDRITLRGAGHGKTVLDGGGPATPVDDVCGGEAGGVDGICVADATVSQNGPPTVNREIEGVRIKKLTVENFGGTGVFFFGAQDQRVSDVLAQDNGGYGIAAFETSGGRYWHNVTPRNHEAGIYVGDSPQADAVVRNNVSYGNLGNGVFIRDAAHGVVEGNDTYDNCIGILFVDTPDEPGSPPEPNRDWTARGNSANHNNVACPASDEGGGSSGLGIVIASAQDITLSHNTANGNAATGETPASGGIIVISFSEGPQPPTVLATGNTVEHNTAFGNSPVDLLWDQQGDNSFVGNRCATSNPDGLCTGKGKHDQAQKGLGAGGDNGPEHGHGNHGRGNHGDNEHGKHGD